MRVETYDIDNPPAGGGTPEQRGAPAVQVHPTYLGVLSHFDAVDYYSGDDFVPQVPDNADPRRMPSATTQTGSFEMAPWAHHVMLELRDYANEGGQAARRRPQRPPGVHHRQPRQHAVGHRPVHLDAGQAVRLLSYPDGNSGDDDVAGTAFPAVAHDVERHVAELPLRDRPAGAGSARRSTPTSPTATPVLTDLPVAPKADGLFAGMGPITLDEGSTGDPNQATDGSALPQRKLPLRLRKLVGLQLQRAAAPRARRGRLPTPPRRRSPAAARSSRPDDAVTFGFGLEQVDEATRNELVKRSMAYLLADRPGHDEADDRRLEVPAGRLHGDARRSGRGGADRL